MQEERGPGPRDARPGLRCSTLREPTPRRTGGYSLAANGARF